MTPAINQPSSTPATAPPSSAFSFRKAELGMTLAEWRASAPYRTVAQCAPASPRTDLVCRAADQPLGGGYRVNDLTSTFSGGRLSQVTFTTSIDAFPYVVAELKRNDGPPDSLERDTAPMMGGLRLPRVRMLWRRRGGAIRLTDPVLVGSRLGLRVALVAGPAVDQARSAESNINSSYE